MCRKNHLHGWCTLVFGLGLMVGHALESWMISCCGGMVLIVMGILMLGRR